MEFLSAIAANLGYAEGGKPRAPPKPRIIFVTGYHIAICTLVLDRGVGGGKVEQKK